MTISQSITCKISFSILVLCSFFVQSHSSLSPSPNSKETSSEHVTNYLRFITLIFAAALQYKQGIFWNEARILRKIKSRHPRAVRASVIPDVLSNPTNPDPYEVFFYLYIEYSKGRHKKYSRIYPTCYYYFNYAIDILDGLIMVTNVDTGLLYSDALMALRLPIYMGSLWVLGASGITFLEAVLLILMAVSVLCCTLLNGTGLISIPDGTHRLFCVLWAVGLGLSIINDLIQFCSILNGSSTTISDIVGGMWLVEREYFTEEASVDRTHRKPIISRLSACQKNRLETVASLVADSTETLGGILKNRSCQRNFTQRVRTRLRSSYFRELRDLLLFWVMALVSIFTWGKQESSRLAPMAFTNLLELVAALMIFINNSRIEAELFEKLMRIAHMH